MTQNTLDSSKSQNGVSARLVLHWIDLLKYLDIQVFCFDVCKTIILLSHSVPNPSMIIMKGMILILFLSLVCAYNDLTVREVKELEVG